MKLIITTFLFVLLFANASLVQAETLTFGIVPQQSAKRLAETWGPVLKIISEKTGKNIQFATAKDIPTFEKRLKNKEYDIAYMNPYHYVVFSEQSGYRALARQKNKKIQGIVVVRKDSTIDSIHDLDGKKVAFPAPAAFAATLIPLANMQRLGIEVEPVYVLSHDSVYFNVEREFLMAGGGIVRTLNTLPESTRSHLKVLWRSEKYTPHAIATKASVSSETREIVLNALLALNDDPAYSERLKVIGFEGFEAAQNADWDDVRELVSSQSISSEQ